MCTVLLPLGVNPIAGNKYISNQIHISSLSELHRLKKIVNDMIYSDVN
jgi:hypothetical protein